MICSRILKNSKRACFLVSTGLLLSCADRLKPMENPQLETGRFAIAKAEAKAECETGFKAFEGSLHPLLRNNCIGCHDSTPNPQAVAAPHSAANSHTSYYYQITYIDWSKMEDSKIMDKVRTAHWKKYPGGDNVKTSEDDVRKALTMWWEGGQKDCPSLGKFISKPASLAGDLSNWKRVSVNLPNETDVLKDGHFSVETKIENGRYYFRKPFIDGVKLPVRVKRIYTVLNGRGYDTPFDQIKGIVEQEASGTTGVLSSHTTSIPVENAATDALSFGFDDLKGVPKFECVNMEEFKKSVKTEIQRRNCTNCHGGEGKAGTANAKNRLNMDANESELCRAMLTRGNGQYTVESPLIAYPLSGVNGHPVVIPHSGEVLPSWLNWVKSEKLHGF